MEQGTRGAAVPWDEAVRVWLRVAALSFGGPAGQIAVMHRILVEEKRWVSEQRFLHALNYCMLLPGPEAQQLATYVGWLLHGTRGGLVAGGLFVLPGFVSILALSVIYAGYQDLWLVEGLFYGLKAAVLAVVVEAVVRIGGRVWKNDLMRAVSAVAFVAIFFWGVPFPAIVAGAALFGLIGHRWWPSWVHVIAADQGPGQASVQRPPLAATLRVVVTWLVLWWAPVLALRLSLGSDHVFTQIGAFFGTVATVTFGGAYAVLAYVAQQAVEQHGWLQPGEMLDGLGMAETTPGPLIQVVQFVGFMAAWRDPGTLSPLTAGVLGAVLTTWVTFAPCFLWIFAGAPYIEWLRGDRRLNAALSTITAAVVGVVLNLALWFALHVLFAELTPWRGPAGVTVLWPSWGSVDGAAAALAAAALVATLWFRVGMGKVLGAAAVAGVLWRGWVG